VTDVASVDVSDTSTTMANAWLDEAEWISCTKSGGSYDGSPYRFVIHTTEGVPDTIDDCRAMAESHGSPPQLWYHPELRWLAQGIGLDRSAYALAHPSGTPSTNQAGAIQVEVFAYAADTWAWTYQCDNIGTDVLAPILRAGWPISSVSADTTGSDGYGSNGDVRFDSSTWASFDGTCVHANVPSNDHWDAGDIDLTRVVRAATGETEPEPEPKPEDDDVANLTICAVGGGDGKQYVTDLATFKRPIANTDDWNHTVWCLVASGAKLYYQTADNPILVPRETLADIPEVRA